MFKKKMFSCMNVLLVFMTLYSPFVKAYEQIQIDELLCVDGLIVLEGTAKAEEYVTLKMYSKDAESRDYSTVFAVKETKSDENGEFSISFVIPDVRNEVSTKGEYVIKLVSDSGTIEHPFVYSSKEERNAFFDKLNAKFNSGEVDALTIKNVLSEETDAFLLTVGVTPELLKEEEPVLDEVSKLICADYGASEKDARALNSLSEKYLHIARVNCYDEQGMGFVLEKRNPDCISAAYNDAEVDRRKFISKAIYLNRPFDTEAAFLNAVKEADALYEICSAKYTGVAAMVENHGALLGITGDANYIEYISSTKKTDISKKLTEKIKDSKVYDQEALIKLIGACIKEVEQESIDNNRNPGGGGSAGGSSGSSITVKVNPGVTTSQQGTQNAGMQTIQFLDLNENHWAYKHILNLAEKKIISGYDDNTIRLDNEVSREEYITMICLAAGIAENVEACDFLDIPDGAWYEKYVGGAVKNGIVSGIGEDLFGSGEKMKRQDAATILCRALNLSLEYDVSRILDYEEISDYALPSVETLYAKGVLSGSNNGCFNPKQNITRAEAATMISIAFGGVSE